MVREPASPRYSHGDEQLINYIPTFVFGLSCQIDVQQVHYFYMVMNKGCHSQIPYLLMYIYHTFGDTYAFKGCN